MILFALEKHLLYVKDHLVCILGSVWSDFLCNSVSRRREQSLAATNTHLVKQQQHKQTAAAATPSPHLPTQDFYGKFGVHPR